MKKELNPVGYATISKLKLISEADTINQSAPYFHIQHEFNELINIGSVTTPFQSQPLDSNFNRALFVAMPADCGVNKNQFPWSGFFSSKKK